MDLQDVINSVRVMGNYMYFSDFNSIRIADPMFKLPQTEKCDLE